MRHYFSGRDCLFFFISASSLLSPFFLMTNWHNSLKSRIINAITEGIITFGIQYADGHLGIEKILCQLLLLGNWNKKIMDGCSNVTTHCKKCPLYCATIKSWNWDLTEILEIVINHKLFRKHSPLSHCNEMQCQEYHSGKFSIFFNK